MSAPKLSIAVEPVSGGKAFFLQLAPKAAGEKGMAKIVLCLRITNNEAATVTVSGIQFSFPGSGAAAVNMQGVKFVLDPAGDEAPGAGTIKAGQTAVWSNGVVDLDPTDAQNIVSNAVFLPLPAPAKVTASISCTGFASPAPVTLDLIPFVKPTPDGALCLPFAPYELTSGEYIVTSAQHWANGGAGGTQIDAHDISIQAVTNGSWSELLPGKDGSKNEHYRIWSKPLRAVADGVVDSWHDGMESNTKLGAFPKPTPDPVAGNHFWIRHGDVKVLYAHMQKGSLPAALKVKGAPVKAQQQLGLAGNSGNATNPHTHMQAQDATTGALRGMPFKNGWVLERAKIAADASGPWVQLNAEGISRDTVAIWPASTFPRTLIAAAGIARSGDWANRYFIRPDRASFEQKAQELFDQKGLRLIQVATYLEHGARRWLGIARSGDWASSFWISPDRQSFEQKAQALFDQHAQRLIHVSTYPEGNARRWVGIARSGDWASSFFISPDRASFEQKAQELFDQKGRRLVYLTTYPEGGARRWVGIARSGDWASSFWVSPDRASFEQKAQALFDQQQRRLIHLSTYVEGGVRRWAGIARSGDWANSFFIRSDLDSFNRTAQDLFDENGRRLSCVEILDNES